MLEAPGDISAMRHEWNSVAKFWSSPATHHRNQGNKSTSSKVLGFVEFGIAQCVSGGVR